MINKKQQLIKELQKLIDRARWGVQTIQTPQATFEDSIELEFTIDCIDHAFSDLTKLINKRSVKK